MAEAESILVFLIGIIGTDLFWNDSRTKVHLLPVGCREF